jgi:putative Mg2+ transporter-C (MgtC) family protein
MQTTVTPGEIALRLLLAAIAGAVVGLNREHGHTAGLRTTLLVCLAAAVAMLQANLLLPAAGKPHDSFVELDLMRLPLGILSGMGFIGAGAVLRKGDRVRGLTTAATLWFVTVMGLCFGGGQLGLGGAAFGLAVVVLWGLKAVERRMPEVRRATLTLTVAAADGPTDAVVRLALTAAGYTVASQGVTSLPRRGRRRTTWDVSWRAPRDEASTPPPLVDALSAHPGTLRLQWHS